ncbi:MATE family efflux transporter [Clostridium sp.]|uniref:MATE family efflux transporter n=1 Tax=Clostridium sp. TaxID=1506 RepID=UPI0025C48917|nr:MATE family efflux transporter [Clostridium sp.]
MSIYHKYRIKEINSLAIPIILSSSSSMLMTLIDEAIIGHLSVNSFAGVNLVVTIINSLIGVLGISSVAFNIMGSKNSEDKEAINQLFSLSIVLGGIIGLICFLIIFIFTKFILSNIFGLNGLALKESLIYTKIFGLTIGLNLIIFIFSTVFKIYRKTKYIFFTTIIVNIINLFLDYSLVFGRFGFPRLNAEGASIGTVISLCINILIYGYFTRNLVKFKLNKNIFKKYINKFIKLSTPLMSQELFQELIFVFGINIIITRLGVIELSTYSLLLNIIQFLLMPMFAYSSTAITLISEYHSKSDYEMCKNISKTITILTLMIFIITLIFVMLFKMDILYLITDDSSIVTSCNKIIFICLIIQLLNIIQNIYKSSLQAIGFEKFVLKYSFIINIITLICIVFLAPKLGLLSIYVLFGINYIILSILFIIKYKANLINSLEGWC